MVKKPPIFADRKVTDRSSNRCVPPETHRKQEPVVRTAAADKRELTHRRQRRTSTEIPKSPKVHKLKEARLRTEPPDPKATNTIDKKQIFTCKRNPIACVQSQED
ncbi:hypothetical protein F2Q68_00016679 [Brassica cretica]|uniref:Uncharacterized protein n=1 Tax=Brassica cretica TaxID=69181 RepID=A0A8S9HHL7_BRACR|nr:hypothetical protein F2Q68_00016679 [Brassica cretica]